METCQMLMPGDLVEVKSEAEILATLDERGTHEKMPFMPEMLKFCGQRFQVSRRAFKTCVDDSDMRQLDNTVFLEDVRCDGAAHGGCGRACLIFWKESWLRRVGTLNGHATASLPKVTAEDLSRLAAGNGQFFCQSSEVINASAPLPWWRPSQYLLDVRYNRLSLAQCGKGFLIAVYNKITYHLGRPGWGSVLGKNGTVPAVTSLKLKPGELVRVKTLDQIKETLDAEGKHKKLLFAPAMADFCGQVMRVRERVDNMVLEGTGEQKQLSDTVLLEGAVCDGVCHRMCPRQSFLFWRECWLERA